MDCVGCRIEPNDDLAGKNHRLVRDKLRSYLGPFLSLSARYCACVSVSFQDHKFNRLSRFHFN